MATLQVRISDLATRVATECKSIRTLVNGNNLDLTALNTSTKTSLVSAINELKTALDSLESSQVVINDSSLLNTEVWSASKVAGEIQLAKDSILNGASTALDTLSEIAAALNNDANFASTITTELSKRVRYDAAQILTAAEKTQACNNIGIGEPDTDFVSSFNSGLI